MMGIAGAKRIKIWAVALGLIGAGIFLLVIASRSSQAVVITPDDPTELTECI